MVSGMRQTPTASMATDSRANSCHELHGDGVEGTATTVGLAPTLTLLTRLEQVREATNNEPWGASSSVMQEIANGTFN